MNQPSSPGGGTSGAGLILVGIGGVLGVVWGGAQLAALGRGQRLDAGLGAAARAGVRLPGQAADPRMAWEPVAQSALPGPVGYWVATGVVAVVVVLLALVALRLFGRRPLGTAERRRLGVDTKARLATASDLRPLIVRGPTTGRLILGRVGRHLVATEVRDPHRRSRGRAGDRSAVALFGPSRCGKSATIISAILENEGPAILSSVKGDLLHATIDRRRRLGGEIKIFDPTGIIAGHRRARWSPVANCSTVTGAKKLAHGLSSANSHALPHDGFFANMAEELLWPMLFCAAMSAATMGDVVRWVLADEAAADEITGRLDRIICSSKPKARRDAVVALRVLQSLWAKEPRIRSSIFATALTMVNAWEDPIVAECSATSEIDLEWLVGGPNTLYVCSPLHEQLRLATVFGGLLDDLLQQAYEWPNHHGSRLPDTLLVLDEAANTPARWLPQVASTCSGIGIQLVTIWQSKAQIDHAYGTLADSVITNHGTKVFFSGISDPATLDYVSRLLGEEEVISRAASNDVGFGRHSINESATRLRLVPADILRQVPPGEGLLIHGTLRPAHLRGRFWYEEKALRRLAGDTAVVASAAALAPPPPPDSCTGASDATDAASPLTISLIDAGPGQSCSGPDRVLAADEGPESPRRHHR